jgi:2-methylisocitrate lyase-like PEP mutase family enzyme
MTKKKSTVLRELIDRKEILFRVGVAIALDAKMAEANGFEAVGISGANFAGQVLGLPDAGLITMTEVVENARRVANAVNIPAMVDCDTGFGNAINVRRTVREVILAGVAGLFIEDQLAPKRCGFVVGKELLDTEEAVGKFRAAVDARDELDPDVVIMARTDARTAVGGSLEEAIARSKAYKEEAGADVSYVEALQSRQEIEAVRKAVPGPLAVSVQALRPLPTLQELEDLGCCMTLSNMFFHAGTVAKWDMLVEMKKHGLGPYHDWVEQHRNHPAAWPRIFERVGFSDVRKWEEKYLSPAQVKAKYEGSQGLFEPGKDEELQPSARQ